MSTTSTTQVQKLQKRYPHRRSAVMDALRLAQEEHGWLSPDVLREVADALDETPAYCHSIASFYDMYHLEPVGKHLVEVCTNLSCALVGRAGGRWTRSRTSSACGRAGRPRTARSRCARSSARAAAAARPWSSSTTSTTSLCAPEDVPEIVEGLRGR